jgi:hypothetical protein
LCKTYNIKTFKFWLKSDKSNECNKILVKIRQQYWTLYVKIYTTVLHAYRILHQILITAKNGADKQEKNSTDILCPTYFSINYMVFQKIKQN